MKASRSNVVSSFTIIKGAMIEETYRVFASWDLGLSKKENLDRLRRDNYIGARTETWLRDVAKVINRRFEPTGRDRPLVVLSKGGVSIDEWKPILLWHLTRDEFLVRDFLENWLFEAHSAGVYRLRPVDLHGYLVSLPDRGASTEHEWTAATANRVAAGLLKIAGDFGLLTQGALREFKTYHMPERSFLYLLHALRDKYGSPAALIDARDWRLYLMRPADVEHELLRLHQYRQVDYQAAGTLVQLTLPCQSATAYAERIAA